MVRSGSGIYDNQALPILLPEGDKVSGTFDMAGPMMLTMCLLL